MPNRFATTFCGRLHIKTDLAVHRLALCNDVIDCARICLLYLWPQHGGSQRRNDHAIDNHHLRHEICILLNEAIATAQNSAEVPNTHAPLGSPSAVDRYQPAQNRVISARHSDFTATK